VPSDEICDGLDNDCDGVADNEACTGGDICCGNGSTFECCSSTECVNGLCCDNAGQTACRAGPNAICCQGTTPQCCPGSNPPRCLPEGELLPGGGLRATRLRRGGRGLRRGGRQLRQCHRLRTVSVADAGLSGQPGDLYREQWGLLEVLSGCGGALRAGGDLRLPGRYDLIGACRTEIGSKGLAPPDGGSD
jgi:hypothetical protein